jgi:hypothetical protein
MTLFDSGIELYLQRLRQLAYSLGVRASENKDRRFIKKQHCMFFKIGLP